MKEDVLNYISKERELTHVIILTHDIDYLFLELNLLRTLSKCGSPSVTILTNASEALDAYRNIGQYLLGLGRRYRVVPIFMKNGRRFHPKAIFASGKKRASLFVGSGNLSFGGWRDNLEIWSKYESDNTGLSTIMQFKEYLRSLLKMVPMEELVSKDIENSYAHSTHAWAVSNLSGEGDLVFLSEYNQSMLLAMQSRLSGQTVDKLIVCAPYFDAEAEALFQIVKTFNIPETQLLIQPRFSNLTKLAGDSLPDNIALMTMTAKYNNGRERFIHSKMYGFETHDGFTVFLGSGNCSKAALTLSKPFSNIELMVIRKLSKEEFATQIMNELTIDHERPVLVNIEEKNIVNENSVPFLALAASYELGKLFIEYDADKTLTVEKCFIDGESTSFSHLKEGIISVECSCKPRRIQLEGSFSGKRVVSNEIWVNDEFDLGCSSSERILAGAIQTATKSGSWSPDAYAEILKYLRKTMEYHHQTGTLIDRDRKDVKKKIPFTAEDLISTETKLQRGPSLSLTGDNWQQIGISRLLLEWFGFTADEETQEERIDQDDANKEGIEEPVDTAEKLLKKPKKIKPIKTFQKIKKRILQTLNEIKTLIASEDYIYNRPLDRVGIDLCIVGFLTLMGKGEGWLSGDEFFDFSADIWIKSFVNCGISLPNDDAIGYLSLAYFANPNPEIFLENVATLDTASILAAWLLSVPEGIETPKRCLLYLAGLKAVSEMPWMWSFEQPDKLGPKVHQILELTGNLQDDSDDVWNRIEEEWGRLRKQGLLLRIVEDRLGSFKMAELKDLISDRKVNIGDLLWQDKFGICIAGASCNRSSDIPIEIYSIKDSRKVLRVHSSYLLPLRDIFLTTYANVRPSELIVCELELLINNLAKVVKAESRFGMQVN